MVFCSNMKLVEKKNIKNIAVLVSTYNGEKNLAKQLDSILAQECDYGVDIYIRDDESDDNTVAIIKQYQKQHKNIFLSQAKNIGCNASFFELLKNTHGYDYYAFSDQDDVWMKDKLQSAINMLEKMQSNNPLLYGSCSTLFNDDLEKLGTTQQKLKDITFYNTIIQNFLPGHSQVMNNELRQAILAKNIDTSQIYYYDSWITNVAMIKGKILFDNNPHTYYRQHDKNELGYGGSRFNWYKERIRRIRDNQSKKYSKQIDYFVEIYHDDLDPEFIDEIKKFQCSKASLTKRIKYISKSKLYRQRNIETKLFKLMYLLKLY